MDTIQIKMSENKYRVDIFMLYILAKRMQKKNIIAWNHSNLYHEKIRGEGGGIKQHFGTQQSSLD